MQYSALGAKDTEMNSVHGMQVIVPEKQRWHLGHGKMTRKSLHTSCVTTINCKFPFTIKNNFVKHFRSSVFSMLRYIILKENTNFV